MVAVLDYLEADVTEWIEYLGNVVMLRCGLALLLWFGVSTVGLAQEPAAVRQPMKWLDQEWSEPTRQLLHVELRNRFARAIKTLRSEEDGSIESCRAIEELQSIIADQTDCLVSSVRTGARFDGVVIQPQHLPSIVSLQEVIEHILAELPSKGREFYELKYGSEASAALKDALAQNQVEQLEFVARRYVLTQAGREAAYRLSSMYFETGRDIAALRMLARAQLGQPDVGTLEPSLSLKRIVALMRLGKKQAAQTALDEFLKGPATKFGDKLPKDWQQELDPRLLRVAESGRREPVRLNEWTHHLGDAARTALPNGVGTPDAGVWEIGTFIPDQKTTPAQQAAYRYDPKKVEDEIKMPVPLNDAEMLAAMQVGHDWIVSAERDEREIELPSNYPLVVDRKAVFRTLSRVKAVDLLTGKSLWETAAPDPAFADLFVPSKKRWEELNRAPQVSVHSSLPQWHQALIESRTRSDRSVGTLSSDGQRVFFLDACGVAHPLAANGIWGTKNNVPNLSNRLCAVDLVTGKALWEIGSPISIDEPTTGEFFLGVPTAIDGRLYAIAESKDDVRLLCLNPSDGSVIWTETICRLLEAQNVVSEGLRRIAGLSPVYCNGQLLCPTSCGFLLAYDLASRRWSWGFGYETSTLHPDVQFRQPAIRMNSVPRMHYDALRSKTRWSESSVVTDGSKVVLASIDSDELHCIDLLTGKGVWSVARLSGHYVAGLYQGRVIVVDRDRVRALSLDNGEPVWTLSLEDRRAAGRGIQNGNSYLLPVSTLPSTSSQDEPINVRWDSRVVTIDLRNGAVTSQSARSSSSPIGNLVAGHGFLVAQAYDRVAAYPPIEQVESLLQQRLSANPKDAEALAHRGRLRLQEQRVEEGMADLLASLEAQPNEDIRETLIDVSLDRLRTGKAQPAELRAFFTKIGASAEVQEKLLRSEINTLRANGNLAAAFRKTIELLNSTALENTQPFGVQGDLIRYRRRGPPALLASIYRDAAQLPKNNARGELDQIIGEQLDTAQKAAGAANLLNFISAFGWHPRSLEARWELATSNRIEGRLKLLQREQQAMLLSQHADLDIAAPATLALLELWKQNGLKGAHQDVVDRWSRRMAGVKLRDGSDFVSKLQELSTDAAFVKLQSTPKWSATAMVEKIATAMPAPDRDIIPHLGLVSPAFRDGTIEVETLGRDARGKRRMVARDSLGREQWQIPILLEGPSTIGAGPIANLSRGHLMATYSAGRLTLLDMSKATSPKALWARDILDFESAYGRHGIEVAPVNSVYAKRPLTRWQLTAGVRQQRHEFTGSVDAITSENVIIRVDNKLSVVDIFSGQVLWTRSNIRPQARVLADDEFIVLHHSNKTSEVLRLFDGEVVGSGTSPDFETHLTSAGRDLVTWDDEDEHCVFQRADALTNKLVWQHKLPAQAVVQVVDHDHVAVMLPSGEFRLFDIWTGRAFVTAKLPEEFLLKNILVVPSPWGHLVMTDMVVATRTTERRQIPVPNSDFNQVRGRMSLVRPDGTVAWTTQLPLQRYLVGQPRDLPLVIFRREAVVRVPDQEGAARRTNDFLILDKRTGQVLFDERPTGSDDSVLIDAQPETGEVLLQFQQLSLSVKFAD